MIDDIVALPSRHASVRTGGAEVSSETAYTLPLSCFCREVGYEEPRDDQWSPLGGKCTVPTGKESWFRFKIIENTRFGRCEYFCLSESPLDLIKPARTKNARIYCLWVTVTDFKTLRTRKYVLWRNIFELNRFEVEDTVHDTPIEGVIANEIREFACLNGCPDLAKEVENYPTDYRDVLISELRYEKDNGLGKLLQLGSNLRAYADAIDCQRWIDIYDIFRGTDLPRIWSDLSPLAACSVLQFVQFGSIYFRDLFPLFSPGYWLHRYQRTFDKKPLEKETILTLPAYDGKDVFAIIKYAEQLPYSEFELKCERGKPANMKVFDRSDACTVVEKDVPDQDTVTKPVIDSILKDLDTAFPNYQSVVVKKSWGEEIYITVVNNDRSVNNYYFDVAIAPICSRALIRDYGGSLFSLGF